MRLVLFFVSMVIALAPMLGFMLFMVILGVQAWDDKGKLVNEWMITKGAHERININ